MVPSEVAEKLSWVATVSLFASYGLYSTAPSSRTPMAPRLVVVVDEYFGVVGRVKE